jgi:hypothetical protein
MELASTITIADKMPSPTLLSTDLASSTISLAEYDDAHPFP